MTDQNIITSEALHEPFTTSPMTLIEGLTSTAYCQPIDVIDSSGAEEANLTIPLTGTYTPNDATNTVIRTAINFMSFVLVLVFTYVITPIIYNDYIVGLVTLTGQQKMNRIRCIDIYITFVFSMAAMSLIGLGVRNNNPNSTIVGFFLGLFFIISFFIIQTKKMNADWFKETFASSKDTIISASYNNINASSDFFGGFLLTNISIFFTMVNLMIGGVIFFIVSSFGYLTGAFGDKGVLNSGDALIYLCLLTIYITIAIDTVRYHAPSLLKTK